MRILLIICFFCVSHAIKADEEKRAIQVTQDNVRYLYLPNDKGVVCTGFADTSKTCNRLIIPDSILVNGDNWSVTTINVNAFKGRKNLQYVKLPNTLLYILSEAFADCENLDSIYIPASVTKLGEKAFANIKKLKHITIPKNIRSIGSDCFCCCNNLSSVSFEDNIDSKSNGLKILLGAFSLCMNITNVSLPNRLDSIGPAVFAECNKLESIYIPDRVCFISKHLFANCKSLKSIIVSPNNKVYDSRDNCNAIIETKTNKLIAGCNSTVIPNSIDTICMGAFTLADIDSIYIPNGVKYIEYTAFFKSKIRSVVIPKSVTEMEAGSFAFCRNLRSMYLGHTTPPEIEDLASLTEDDMKEILTTEEEKDEDETVGFSYLKYLKNVCVYVPKIAYKKYKKHPIWKQLRIMPY